MAFSKPDDPESQLQKSVDAARDACKWMNDELGAARKTAADALNASRKAIRERKISEPLEQKQLAADLRVSNLAAELDHAKTDLDRLEKDLARCRKAKQCEADAAEFDKRVSLYADKGDAAIKAIAEWAEAMKPLTPDLPDLLQSFLFFSNVAIDSPANREMNLTLAQQRRNAILAGAATLSRPAPPPAPVPLPAPTVPVTALRAVAWMAHGMVQTAAPGADLDLSPATAQRGIKLGACVTMDDPRRKAIKSTGGFKVGKPLRRNCIDLDPDMPPDDEAEPFRQPVLRSVPPNTVDPRLIPVDRGPPRQMTVARNDLDAIATRNKDKGDKP